jgi:hypothetical protein
MAKKNLPKIVVITDISTLDTPNMVSEAKGVVLTGDPDATTPPITDTILKAEADDLLDIHTARQTNPPTATADDEIVQRDKLAVDYQADALYVQTVANKVAKAAGDVAAGEVVVQRIGMKLKSKGTPHPRSFEVVASGIGWVHLRVKSVAKRAGYGWKYGITPVKDTPPAAFSPIIFTLGVELVITNLQSGEIYGFQYGSILPERKPSVSDGSDPITFSDFIYFVIP